MVSKQASAEINLDAIAHNYRLAKTRSGMSVMAVIKGDAYGHGAVKVATSLPSADAFAVARISEAVRLREGGVANRICLLEGAMTREELNLASIYELELVVHDIEQLAIMSKAGSRRRVWLKFDTGMGRLGIRPEDIDQVLGALGHQTPVGIMTHLANADDPNDEKTARQIEAISMISQSLAGRLNNADVVSVANSAGILGPRSCEASWCRPGLMLYGATPFDDLQPHPDLMPAMTFTAPVISVRTIKQGETVGYSGTWTAGADTRVAVLAVGYADGYPREIAPQTPVLIGGEERNIVGRVSMDMICVELEPRDQVGINDRAVLWGEGLPIERIARAAGTIPYTLMCGVTERVVRIHRGEMGRRGYG